MFFFPVASRGKRWFSKTESPIGFARHNDEKSKIPNISLEIAFITQDSCTECSSQCNENSHLYLGRKVYRTVTGVELLHPEIKFKTESDNKNCNYEIKFKKRNNSRNRVIIAYCPIDAIIDTCIHLNMISTEFFGRNVREFVNCQFL